MCYFWAYKYRQPHSGSLIFLQITSDSDALMYYSRCQIILTFSSHTFMKSSLLMGLFSQVKLKQPITPFFQKNPAAASRQQGTY